MWVKLSSQVPWKPSWSLSVLFDPGIIRQAEWTVSGMGHPIPGTVGSRMRIRIFHSQLLRLLPPR